MNNFIANLPKPQRLKVGFMCLRSMAEAISYQIYHDPNHQDYSNSIHHEFCKILSKKGMKVFCCPETLNEYQVCTGKQWGNGDLTESDITIYIKILKDKIK